MTTPRANASPTGRLFATAFRGAAAVVACVAVIGLSGGAGELCGDDAGRWGCRARSRRLFDQKVKPSAKPTAKSTVKAPPPKPVQKTITITGPGIDKTLTIRSDTQSALYTSMLGPGHVDERADAERHEHATELRSGLRGHAADRRRGDGDVHALPGMRRRRPGLSPGPERRPRRAASSHR